MYYIMAGVKIMDGPYDTLQRTTLTLLGQLSEWLHPKRTIPHG